MTDTKHTGKHSVNLWKSSIALVCSNRSPVLLLLAVLSAAALLTTISMANVHAQTMCEGSVLRMPSDGRLLTIEGSLKVSNCLDDQYGGDASRVDVYSFTLDSDTMMDISLWPFEWSFEGYLRLTDESGSELEAGSNFVRRDLAAGSYEVLVGSQDGVYGDYELRFADPGCEVQTLTVPLTIVGSLSDGDCLDQFHRAERVDVYDLHLPVAMDVTIELDSEDFEPLLRLRGDDGHSPISRTGGTLYAGSYRLVVTADPVFVDGWPQLGVARGIYRLTIDAVLSSPEATTRPFPACFHQRLSFPSTRTGSLTTSGCHTVFWVRDLSGSFGNNVDIYGFNLATAAEVVVDLRSLEFDTYLILLSESESESGVEIAEIQSDDDGGEDRNSRISRSLQAGWYRIIVSSNARHQPEHSGTYGRYSLSIRTPQADLFAGAEVGDQYWRIGQAVSLQLPAAASGSSLFDYAVRYEFLGRSWRPEGIHFDPESRRLSGVPLFEANPDPALRRFTVILHAEERLGSGDWDEIEFTVHVLPENTVTLTVDSDPSGGQSGHVQITNGAGDIPGRREFGRLEIATIRAIAAEGWRFTGWSGSGTIFNTEAYPHVASLIMSGDRRVVAHFAPVPVRLSATVEDSVTRPSSDTQALRVAEALFNPPDVRHGDRNYVSDLVWNYNNWRATPRDIYGYRGGHSGHDFQTSSVQPVQNDAGGTLRQRANRITFYSLTEGVVTRAEGPPIDYPDEKMKEYCESTTYVSRWKGDCPNTTVAVRYTDVDGMVRTVQYLHAREILVKFGQEVVVGTPLGIMGSRGYSDGVHVHVEVHKGDSKYNSCGANCTVDPIPLLYQYLRTHGE